MRKSFDERAKNWDEDPKKVERAQLTAGAIRKTARLRPGMSAFEYGCGTGLLSFALKDAFAHITLADTSEGMLEVLKQKIAASKATHMHPIRLDLNSDPLPAQRHDIIYSLVTLHHIPDTQGVLHKFNQLLAPGGTLCIADLDKEDGSFHGPEVQVHHGFDRDKLRQQVAAAGFSHIQFETILEIRKSVNGAEKNFPVFLMTAEKSAAQAS